MIAGVVILHVWALHVTGQTNPTGVEVKDIRKETVPFTPYATIKDALAMVLFFMLFAWFVFYPAGLSRPSGQLHPGRSAEDAGAYRSRMVLPAVLRDPARHHLQHHDSVHRHRADRHQARRRDCDVRLDRGAVRSCPGSTRRRSVRRTIARSTGSSSGYSRSCASVLGYLGSRPAEGIYPLLSLILTIYYFAHFFIILPLLGMVRDAEGTLPASIADAVLEQARAVNARSAPSRQNDREPGETEP